MDVRPGGSVVRQRQLVVGYGMFRARGVCECQFLRRGTCSVWVLLSRADRDRRAERTAG